jgi:hypothetical protein
MGFSSRLFSSCVSTDSAKGYKEYPEKLYIQQYKLFNYIKDLKDEPSKLGEIQFFIRDEQAIVTKYKASEKASFLPAARKYLKAWCKANQGLFEETKQQPTSPSNKVYPDDFFTTIEKPRDDAEENSGVFTPASDATASRSDSKLSV